MHQPQTRCKKCKVVIRVDGDAGQCTVCHSKEHYRCTKVGKRLIKQYQDGTIPFKCAACCLPGIDLTPQTDIRTTLVENSKVSNSNEGCQQEDSNDENNAGAQRTR